MKKIFLLIVAFGCMAAQAQTEKFDAISATQGESTDWYRFADYNDVVEVSITAQGIQFPGDPGKTYAIANGAVYTAFGTAPEEKITLTAADLTVTKDGDWIYDQTEKRVNVEFNPELVAPSKDNITIYYNNDKLVKPINAGTYQVYIDIEETTDYNAVTGLTSDDWKLTIEKADLTASDFTYLAPDNLDWDGNEKTATVTFNDQGKLTGCGEITIKYQKDAVETSPVDVGDYTVSIDVAEGANYNAIENLTDEDWTFTILDPLSEIKETAITDINNVAAAAKEEIDGLGVDESAKSEAKAQIDNIANTAEQTINAATSEDAIDNAKTEAIAKIHDVVQTTKNMWVTVREGMTINDYGTLCWDYNLTDIEGAELYTIAGKENNRIVLEEVKVEETQAGAGYVILATAETLRVKNGDQQTDTPLDAADCNGLQGTFAEIVDGATGAAGNILEGNYIVYNNEWRLCGGYTGLRANCAYLILDAIPNKVPIKAPNRKYISMPLPGGTPTGNSSLHHSNNSSFKMIKDGQFVIIKDNKMYNAQGIEL